MHEDRLNVDSRNLISSVSRKVRKFNHEIDESVDVVSRKIFGAVPIKEVEIHPAGLGDDGGVASRRPHGHQVNVVSRDSGAKGRTEFHACVDDAFGI